MQNRTLYKAIAAILIIVVAYFAYRAVPYLVANYQYEQLVAQKGLTKQTIEGTLFLYSSKQIPIEDSLWGKEAKLEDGEVCWQYSILWKEPIDVIYNNQRKVVRIFASYE